MFLICNISRFNNWRLQEGLESERLQEIENGQRIDGQERDQRGGCCQQNGILSDRGCDPSHELADSHAGSKIENEGARRTVKTQTGCQHGYIPSDPLFTISILRRDPKP